jgi:hemerythrin
MAGLKWSESHAVFVAEIDDEHREVFAAVTQLDEASRGGELPQVRKAAQRLTARMSEHFAHEERLMRAARYESLRWHKQRHDGARKRADAFTARIEVGELGAATELAEFIRAWLPDHAAVADRMMGAALRNHRLSTWKVTFQAGTKPLDSCSWVRADGEPFEP